MEGDCDKPEERSASAKRDASDNPPRQSRSGCILEQAQTRHEALAAARAAATLAAACAWHAAALASAILAFATLSAASDILDIAKLLYTLSGYSKVPAQVRRCVAWSGRFAVEI